MIKTKDEVKVAAKPKRALPVRAIAPVVKAEAGGSGPPLRPPVAVASPDEGGYPKRIILHMSEGLARWLDEEWHRRRLPSRAETIRVILTEARAAK